MRIHEIIQESVKCNPGWNSFTEDAKTGGGYYIFSYRFTSDCRIDEMLLAYYNKNLLVASDENNKFGLIVSVKVKNNRITWYDYFANGDEPTYYGEYSSRVNMKDLFFKLRSQYT